MERQTRNGVWPLLLRRWFFIIFSVLLPFVVLLAILLSARSAGAEPLAPTATVSGVVVNPDGSTIGGATEVCLYHLHPEEGWVDWENCKGSAIDGSFVFTGAIPLGDLFVQAEPLWNGGYFPSLQHPLRIEAVTDTVDVGSLRLTYASFAGMVYEPGGVTPADAGWVSVMNADEADVAGGDYETGTYAIGGVPAGNFVLVAHPPEGSLFWHSPPMPVTVTEGSQYLPTATQAISLELTMAQLVVYVVTPAGDLITANVHLWNEVVDFDMWRWSTPSAPATFGDLDVGEVYMLDAWPRVEEIPQLASSAMVTVVVGAGPISRTLILREPNVVGVAVTPDGNLLPPAYDQEGNPIPEPAIIRVREAHTGFELEAPTNPDGQFGLALPSGDYVFSVHPNPETTLAFTYTRSLPDGFGLGGTVILPEVDLGQVRLTYPSVAGQVLDPSGAQISGCLSVWLEDMAGEWVAEDWYCGDQNPPYRLGGVPDGDYWLKADGLPAQGLFSPEPVWTHIPPGSQYNVTATQIHDLHLTEAQLEVSVEYPTGTLVPARVMLWSEWGFETWGNSSPDGPARFGALPEGDYWLQAWPTWQDIPERANSTKEAIYIGDHVGIDVVMGPMTRTLFLRAPDITGTVETPEGGPLPPAYDEEGNWTPDPAKVYAHNPDWSVNVWATTNPTGEFSLSLPDGEYELLAEPMHDLVFLYTKSDLVPFALSPTVTRPHGLGYIPLTYPRIWGTVVDWEDNPVETWVDLWSEDRDYWDGDDTYWYRPEQLKPFRFGGMPPGHYFVQANPPDHNPEGYGPSNIIEFDVPPTHTEQITLHLSMANVLGYVRLPEDYADCPGCPVPGVDVRVLRDLEDDFEEWACTGDDGRFTFRLDPGNYAMEVLLPSEWLAMWDPPVPEAFTLGSPPDMYTTTLYLQPAAERIQVTGEVKTPPNGDPPPAGSTWIDLCNDEGLCFGNEVAASGRFTVPVLPGIYEVWTWVEPATGLLPPLDNGFSILVEDDLALDPIWLRILADRTAHVSGRVIIITTTTTGAGLPGVDVEAWTDEGDWVATRTVTDGNYSLNLFPGHWHGGPVLTPEQEDEYIVLPPRHRDGYMEAGEEATNVDFYLLRRDATIRGQVVELGQTSPITDIDAVVFAEICGDEHCWVIDESPVVTSTFELRVRQGFTYSLGIWLPPGNYLPGPPVTVTTVSSLTTGVQVSVIEAGTRIWGHLLDGDTLEPVEIDAHVYGHDPEGLWVEDELRRDDDPYQYNLYVPTPVAEPVTWTLGLWVDPSTGYVADPAHPRYKVIVEPGDTSVGQVMYVKKLDTFIVGRVGVAAGNVFSPARYVLVFAEGVTGTTEGLYFEAQANASGVFTIPVLPGQYEVGAYLPPNMVDDFFPPPMQPWASMDDNPVYLLFRHRPPAGELEICGSLSVSPTGSISPTAPIFVSGRSNLGGYSEVTGTIGGGYCLPVISGTVWHVWAAYENSAGDVYYESQEESVPVGNATVTGVDLLLKRASYDLPDAECWTFDPSRFKRISLPAWGALPEPLVEIQAGTMPVTDDVTICATPVVAVPNGRHLIGYAYEMEARDRSGNLITEDFNKSVRFIFYLSEEAVGDVDPADLALGFYSTARGEWVDLDEIYYTWDDPYWFFTGKVDHFTKMGIMSPPVEGGKGVRYNIYLPLVLRSYGS